MLVSGAVIVLMALLITVVVTKSSSPPEQPPGRLVYVADYETGNLEQWSAAQRFNPDFISVQSGVVRQGRFAGRFEVRNGECLMGDCGRGGGGPRSRSEVLVNGARHHIEEGDERWYRWFSYFPVQTPYQRHLFMQLFADDNRGSRYSEVGHHGLMNIAPNPDGKGGVIKFQRNGDRFTMPARRDVWIKFELRVLYHNDPAKGLYELWVDGRKVMSFHDSSKPANTGVYFKQGIYQNVESPDTVAYHDGLRIATSRAVADAG